MKKIKNLVLPFVVVLIIAMASGNAKNPEVLNDNKQDFDLKVNPVQTINLFVSHGHCSTPFGGLVSNLDINLNKRVDLGNPLEDMKIAFEIDPNSFNACSGEDVTNRVKTPGLFLTEKSENITFKSTQVYTMGMDWYQINGKLSIKGVERDVKLFATGIRAPQASMTHTLILEGQMNLLDWGIDYDLIVNGKSDEVPTKWMHINMKIDLS